MARIQREFMVVTNHYAVDLTNADGDITIGTVPWDGARVARWHATIATDGTGTGTHDIVLEAGLGAAGIAISQIIVGLDANGSGVGTTYAGQGLSNPLATAKVQLTEGNVLQIKNDEQGSVSNGLIIDVTVVWGS